MLGFMMTYIGTMNYIACVGDAPFKCLTYQLSMVGYWLTMATTGNWGLGFDSGEEPGKWLPHLRKAAGAQITKS